MLNVRKQLPQLDPLIAFEAAARHSSFAEAAKELNVTASAVSQQVRTLETQLGVSLFERGHRSVSLTARGREFQNSVSIALMHLVNAAAEARAGEQVEHLDIATDTSIAAFWLMPRLEKFAQLHPDVSVRVSATDVHGDLLGGAFDVAIVHGEGNWPGHDSQRLFEEEVFPVCAPAYLESIGGDLPLDAIGTCALLDLEYERWHWMNWPIWLTEMGMSVPEAPRKLRTNNYTLIIEAARRGAGLALGWKHLVDADLASGALVRPIDGVVKTRFAYHLAWTHNADVPPAAAAFRDWLLEEVARA